MKGHGPTIMISPDKITPKIFNVKIWFSCFFGLFYAIRRFACRNCLTWHSQQSISKLHQNPNRIVAPGMARVNVRQMPRYILEITKHLQWVTKQPPPWACCRPAQLHPRLCDVIHNVIFANRTFSSRTAEDSDSEVSTSSRDSDPIDATFASISTRSSGTSLASAWPSTEQKAEAHIHIIHLFVPSLLPVLKSTVIQNLWKKSSRFHVSVSSQCCTQWTIVLKNLFACHAHHP